VGLGSWPFDEEEFEFTCMLDAQPLFTSRILGEPILVLHRFGGTYGPVRYELTATKPAEGLAGSDYLQPGDHGALSIWLSFANRWGVPVRTVELPVRCSRIDPANHAGRPVPVDRVVYAVATAVLNGHPVVVAGGDATIRVWDMTSGRLIGETITGHGGPVYAVAVAERQGRPVIVSGGDDAGDDDTIRVWDLASGRQVLPEIDGHDDVVSAVAVGELEGRPVIVSGSVDETIQVWDLTSGTPVLSPIDAHDDVVSAVAVGELEGRPVIVSGSFDRTIRVWDLGSGEPVLRPLTGHEYGVDAVAVGELEGRPVIVSGSFDRTIRIWDLRSGEPVLRPLTGHDGRVNAVAVAKQDGRPVIVSGSDDRTVRVWDLRSGALVGEPFTGHSGAVNAVAVGQTGGRPAVVSGGDSTVRVWDLTSGELVAGPLISPVGMVARRSEQPDLAESAAYIFWLMLRNVASDTVVFTDRADSQQSSRPGCIIASPSFPSDQSTVARNYVYNWTRDAAIVAIELAAGPLPTNRPLIDYVRFVHACQTSASELGHLDRASFLVDGTPRDWTDQSDGPALQTLAILRLFGKLDRPTQVMATAVITANLNFLRTAYQDGTYNLWEEGYGTSFFARSVQLKCFQAITANAIGIPVPDWLSTAISWLQSALDNHWNGQYYQSLLPIPAGQAPYDPNIDVVMAAVYGAVAVTDTRLLATAELLRSQWADPGSAYYYPINGADQQRGVGPMLGRYPGDLYDGDTRVPNGDHPWALATANFAELYYRLAKQISSAAAIPLDDLSADFFSQLGVNTSTTPTAAAAALRAAGDRMLHAVIFHSDDRRLSEQFDAVTGYEKSVRNLSWSYASFLSAVRARSQ
jgi:glucoamylase